MSGENEATRQSDNIKGMRVGEGAVFAVSGSAGAIDLRTIPPLVGPDAKTPEPAPGGPGHFISVYADGADLGIILGPTFASVTGGAAPVLANVGTVSGSTGAYTAAAGTCQRIPAGQVAQFRPAVGLDAFLGFVASASGNARIWRSSQ